jgi:hypothetical protein
VNQAHGHDWDFFVFAAIGFLIVFGFLTALTIGAPLILVGLALLTWQWIRASAWHAELGLLAGAGVVCFVVASLATLGSPMAWASVGAVLVSISSITFWWLRCRPSTR